MNPIQLFNLWHREELEKTDLRLPSACCLSTIGLDGYPNARSVSLKEVKQIELIVTGSLDSLKGLEIAQINKLALTFWWTATERQVRIQGDATVLTTAEAEHYFSERTREAQLVSVVSNQGQRIDDLSVLDKKYRETAIQFKDKPITRPGNWAGFSITPVRIEFMEFKSTRFHIRTLYERAGGQWEKNLLQP